MKAKVAKLQMVELEKGEYAVTAHGQEVNRYHNIDAAVAALSFVPLGSEASKFTTAYKGHTIVQTLSAYFVTTTATPFKTAHIGFAFKHIDQAVA
jgi:hypothetical protein